MNYITKTKNLMVEKGLKKLYLSNKWHSMVVDTETLNDDKLIIEFGMTMINNHTFKQEGIYCLIKEVWENKELLTKELQECVLPNPNKTTTNYALEKIERWQRQVDNKELEVISMFELVKRTNNLIKKYETEYFMAYNVAFDKQAIRNTCEILGVKYCKMNYLKPIDIWYLSNCITMTREYKKFCKENNFVTEKGNIKTSAECVYRFLSYKTNFIEDHLAKSDIDIEIDILKYCLTKNGVHLIPSLKNHFNYYTQSTKK